VPWRNCITISGDCLSAGPRCGRCYITSIVEPGMVQHQRSFPDLFETALSHLEALPRPRQRKHEVALRAYPIRDGKACTRAVLFAYWDRL
jgi:hypothetical protein